MKTFIATLLLLLLVSTPVLASNFNWVYAGHYDGPTFQAAVYYDSANIKEAANGMRTAVTELVHQDGEVDYYVAIELCEQHEYAYVHIDATSAIDPKHSIVGPFPVQPNTSGDVLYKAICGALLPN